MTSEKVGGARLCLVIALAAFGACAEDVAAGSGIAESDAAQAIARTLCEQVEACACADAPPLEECSMTALSYWEATLEGGENGAGLTYDGNCVAEFLDSRQALACRTDFEDEVVADVLGSCSVCKFFFGPKKEGEACEPSDPDASSYFGDDCVQGLECRVGRAQCVDPCARAAEGESCIGMECEPGLACVFRQPDEVCVRPASLGEDCSEVPCVPDTDCSPETSTCVEPPPLPGLGESCILTRARGDGSYCDESNGPNDPGVCAARGAEGAACQSNKACESGACRSGVCVPPVPIVCL